MNCLIVLISHSSYIDICKDFVSLFKKNWPDCPFKFVCAIIGDNKNIDGIETIYVDDGKILTDCFRKVMEIYPSNYYMCFLGDAFISKKIDNSKVISLLKELNERCAHYCKIIPMNNNKLKRQSGIVSNIKTTDGYAHTFVSFIASSAFINNELIGKTDLEFETKYLEIAGNEQTNDIFENDYIVLNNIFNIIPTVVKGKWDRIALKKVKMRNPSMKFSNRAKMSVLEQFKVSLINFSEKFLSRKLIKFLKKILSTVGFKFTTNY